MKMCSLRYVLGVACSFVIGSSTALAQDGPPVDLKSALETLKQSKEKRTTNEKANLAKLTQDFRAAAANNAAAINFYETAILATKFDGKSSERADFQEWRKNNSERLRCDAMQNASRLHLNYLLLSLQRANGATTQQLEQPLLAHIAAVTAAGADDTNILNKHIKANDLLEATGKGKRPDEQRERNWRREHLFWEQDIINQGISASIFVNWYGAQKTFSNLKEWESNPGNLDGMYTQTLLPYYRQNKDPRAITYWDEKMQREAQAVSGSDLSFKIDQFNKVRRPTLLWQRATDMIAIGQRNRGLSEMLGLIKNYPDHPELPGWIGTVEGMITPPPASAAPAAGAAATGTTPTAPAPQ